MRVLLVEPYCSGSHQAWAEGYRRASRHDVQLISHPGSSWRWRMRGAALTLGAAVRESVERHGRPDAVLVSGMIDAAALLGLSRPALDGVPVALYLHENQLTYPPAPDRRGRGDELSFGLVNWLSMAAAEAVFVNSQHHRQSLEAALPRLLRRFPDQTHLPWLEEVLERTAVLPVGVDLQRIDDVPRARDPGPPVVLWNARWEHDKAPERFCAAVDRAAAAGHDFRLALCGEQPAGETPLHRLARRHPDRVVQWGFADDDRYVELLRAATVVVSTAEHEFFGVAVVEAMYAGVLPVLPRRLSYPELVPDHLHDTCLYDDDAGLDARLTAAVADAGRSDALGQALRPAMARYDWSQVAPRYDDALEDLASRRRTRCR